MSVVLSVFGNDGLTLPALPVEGFALGLVQVQMLGESIMDCWKDQPLMERSTITYGLSGVLRRCVSTVVQRSRTVLSGRTFTMRSLIEMT